MIRLFFRKTLVTEILEPLVSTEREGSDKVTSGSSQGHEGKGATNGRKNSEGMEINRLS